MNGPVFTINFRREIYEREIARSRQRIYRLALWMAYFGLLGLILLSYGLNYVGMVRRTRQIERQTQQFVAAQNLPRKIPLDPAQIAVIERFHKSSRRWRDKLARLATLVPNQAVLTSVGVNPGGSNQPADQEKLVIIGSVRAAEGDDPMRGVVQIVAALQADSLFAGGYRSIKLAQSHVGSGPQAATEFTIECR